MKAPPADRGTSAQLGLLAQRYLPLAAPSLLLIVLALPVLPFPFLTDDFNFIHRAREFSLSQLLPDAHVALYRPLSREVYFGLVTALGGNNPIWGHLLNLILAIACVVLVTSIARRLAGRQVGLLSGLFFASLGPLPMIVGWISCSQDLLAMLFTLGAIRFQLAGRTAAALGFMGAALLSKETALFALPGLALMNGIVGRDWAAAKRNAVYYAGLGVLWAALNAKVRGLVTEGFATGTGGYVGLDNPRLLTNMLREFAALVNLPVTATSWPSGQEWVAMVGVAILALVILPNRFSPPPSRLPVPRSRILLLGAVLGIIPAVLTAVSAKHWFPYYACFPAIGTSLLLSMGVLRLGRRYVLPTLVAFLLLGIWTRGTVIGPRILPTEQNFRLLSVDLNRINARLHQLHPSFPDSSRLYIAVQGPVETGLPYHMFSVQAPRIWYWNPTLVTDDPGRLHPGTGPEYLFWVTRDAEVFEIQLPEMKTRSAGPRPAYRDYQSTMRTFAYGLVASGETDRAISAILRMNQLDSLTWAFDRRLAATFLFASGRNAEAEILCRGLPDLPRSNALYAVAAVLGYEAPGLNLDSAAFRAYGLSQDDPESYRFLMHHFSDNLKFRQTKRMAGHLLSLIPRDVEGLAMIEAIRQVPDWEDPVLPVRGRPRNR